MDSRTTIVPRRGMLLAFACLFLLGVMPIISNGRPAAFGALIFALFLSVWQLLFSLPLLIREWRKGERGLFKVALSPAQKRRTLMITLFTGILFGLSTWAYVLAFEKAGAINAAIALQAYPLFAMALEALFLGRRKSRTELGFTVLIVIALYFLATRGTWRMVGLSPLFGLALGVPALWSVAHIILKQVLDTTPITPNQVTTSRLVVSTLFLLPVAIGIEGTADFEQAATNVGLQSFAVAMGLVYYLELVLWFNAMRHIDVSIASSITVPAPAVTMILAILYLGDTAHGYQLVAMGLVIAGLYGLLRSGVTKRSATNSSQTTVTDTLADG